MAEAAGAAETCLPRVCMAVSHMPPPASSLGLRAFLPHARAQQGWPTAGSKPREAHSPPRSSLSAGY